VRSLLRRWLTADPRLTDVAERRTVELVAFLLVLMFAASFVLAAVAAFVAPSWSADRIPVVVGLLLTYVVLLRVNQTRHHRIAAYLVTLAPLIGNIATGLTDPHDPAWFAFVPISSVLAGSLLSLRSAIAISVCGVLGTAVVVAIHYADLGTTRALVFVGFVLLFDILVVGMARFRNRVEQARVAEVERLAAQLAATERLESIGRFAGGVAHDFNNLLTVIIANTELAKRGRGGTATLEGIEDAATRAAALTRQLLAFTRNRTGVVKTLSLADFIREMTPLLRRLVPEHISLELALASTWAVDGDEAQLQQVVMNLAANARDAMKSGGTLRFESRDVPGVGDAVDRVCLVVQDTGTGMDAATRAHAFEPFFTTKPVGEGTGLGLATVHGIVRQAGGTVTLDSVLNEGTTITIHLARSTRTPASAVRGRGGVSVTRDSATVLLVEDNPDVRSSVERILRELGLDVVVAANAEEVARAIREAPNPIDLLVSDVVMPGASGMQVADDLRAANPSISTLLMSGYSEDDVIAYVAAHPETRFLAKPFTAAALQLAVSELLEARRAVRASAS
jgi:signal transduction histidine kinase/ActR/RegA family two-component response regulator